MPSIDVLRSELEKKTRHLEAQDRKVLEAYAADSGRNLEGLTSFEREVVELMRQIDDRVTVVARSLDSGVLE